MPRTLALLIICLGCAPLQSTAQPSQTQINLDELSIPSLPEWTDRYAAGKRGCSLFQPDSFDGGFKLNRLQAVELQNTYRDITRAEPDGDRNSAFDRALKAVRAGQLESRVKDHL